MGHLSVKAENREEGPVFNKGKAARQTPNKKEKKFEHGCACEVKEEPLGVEREEKRNRIYKKYDIKREREGEIQDLLLSDEEEKKK